MYTKNLEKRLYTFPHFMLSPLAKGIQTTHSTVEMFNKYVPHKENNYEVRIQDDLEKDPFEILFDWSNNHKTEIMLNPGVSGNLEDLKYVLEDPENFYPWAVFYEDEYSLKGIMTAISIVLTEKIYYSADIIKRNKDIFGINVNTRRIYCTDTSKTDLDTLEQLESYGIFNPFEYELVQRLGSYRLAN